MSFLRLEDRPQTVRWAVYLLLASLAAGLLFSLEGAIVHWGATTPATLVTPLIGWSLNLGLVLAIAWGRRWALILYIVFLVGGVAQFAVFGIGDPGLPTLAWYAVDAVAVVLLLLPESRRWFASSTAARRGSVTAP